MFVKNEAKVTSRVSGVKRRVMYFSSCCLSPMRRNSVLEELRVKIRHTHTRNSVGWQFSGSKHNITRVESGVVDTTQLMVIGRSEVLERRFDPLQTGQVARCQHVDERTVSLDCQLLLLAC